jgi:hypothetical protein
MTKIYEDGGDYIGEVLPDDEFAALTGDQFREALSNGTENELVIIRFPNGDLGIWDCSRTDWHDGQPEGTAAA